MLPDIRLQPSTLLRSKLEEADGELAAGHPNDMGSRDGERAVPIWERDGQGQQRTPGDWAIRFDLAPRYGNIFGQSLAHMGLAWNLA